jgi:hypothetical protein
VVAPLALHWLASKGCKGAATGAAAAVVHARGRLPRPVGSGRLGSQHSRHGVALCSSGASSRTPAMRRQRRGSKIVKKQRWGLDCSQMQWQ